MKVLLILVSIFSFLFSSIDKFDSSMKKASIYSIEKDTAKIDIPNLHLGQSGIIVHKYKNSKVVLKEAIVIYTNKKYSKIKFLKDEVLKQDAIPTLDKQVQNGDIFVLNHLYKTSMLIVPNFEASQFVKKSFKKQNFLSEDYFAAYLKLDNNPTPTKDDIQNFCKENQIGTIFFVVNKTLYVVDSLSFKIIYTTKIKLKEKKNQVPFFTKITKIEKGFWDWFSEDKIYNYNRYYSKMLGI